MIDYLGGLFIHLIGGIIFSLIFGTVLVGIIAVLGALFGFSVGVFKIFLGVYVFFVLVGRSTWHGMHFSLLRGNH